MPDTRNPLATFLGDQFLNTSRQGFDRAIQDVEDQTAQANEERERNLADQEEARRSGQDFIDHTEEAKAANRNYEEATEALRIAQIEEEAETSEFVRGLLDNFNESYEELQRRDRQASQQAEALQNEMMGLNADGTERNFWESMTAAVFNKNGVAQSRLQTVQGQQQVINQRKQVNRAAQAHALDSYPKMLELQTDAEGEALLGLVDETIDQNIALFDAKQQSNIHDTLVAQAGMSERSVNQAMNLAQLANIPVENYSRSISNILQAEQIRLGYEQISSAKSQAAKERESIERMKEDYLPTARRYLEQYDYDIDPEILAEALADPGNPSNELFIRSNGAVVEGFFNMYTGSGARTQMSIQQRLLEMPSADIPRIISQGEVGGPENQQMYSLVRNSADQLYEAYLNEASPVDEPVGREEFFNSRDNWENIQQHALQEYERLSQNAGEAQEYLGMQFQTSTLFSAETGINTAQFMNQNAEVLTSWADNLQNAYNNHENVSRDAAGEGAVFSEAARENYTQRFSEMYQQNIDSGMEPHRALQVTSDNLMDSISEEAEVLAETYQRNAGLTSTSLGKDVDSWSAKIKSSGSMSPVTYDLLEPAQVELILTNALRGVQIRNNVFSRENQRAQNPQSGITPQPLRNR